jgi:hypothetical protein
MHGASQKHSNTGLFFTPTGLLSLLQKQKSPAEVAVSLVEDNLGE